MNDAYEDERHTAYHEAAHAVIGYRFDLGGFEISIVPNHDKGLVGYHIQENWDGTERGAREQIISYLSGMEADRIAFDGMIPIGAEEDEELAISLLQFLSEGKTLEMFRIDTLKIVRENWKHISAVAEEILNSKTLCMDEWQTIIDAIDDGKDWKENLQTLRINMSILKSK